MNKHKLTKYFRWALLSLFVILITYASYLHQVIGGDKAPSIHALCPFGGLESLYQLFSTGSFISKIFTGTMTLFALTLVIAVLFRRSFCGMICPFGAIQEFFAKLGQLIFKQRTVMPAALDRPLRYLKYAVLVVTVIYAWKTAGLWMAPYDPWSVYGHLSEGLESVWNESAVGLILLLITVLGSLIYDRFFCKYLCPMGALYAIIGKLSPFKVVRNESTCVNCGMCNKKCPMNIDIQHSLIISSAECINCQTCILNCPKTDTLNSYAGKKTMKPLPAMVLLMVLFFGSIYAAKAAEVYALTPGTPKAGEIIEYDEIKGYMSIREAAAASDTELEEFYDIFMIPSNVPAETKMKEISKVSPSYDFDSAKDSLKN